MSIDDQLLTIEQKRLNWRTMLDEGTLSQNMYDGLVEASQEEERLLGRAYVINPKEKESIDVKPERSTGAGG